MAINKSDKIDKIREKADNKIKLLTIRNDIDIEKLNLDNKLLNAKNETLEIKYNNTLLQNKTNLFDRLRTSGRVLSLLGIFSFIVSTILSLISGYTVIKNIVLFTGFALIMSVCQIIIFISAKYNTVTKEKFTHRYAGLKAMQLSMLLVSLTLNVMFIDECFNSLLLDIIMFPLAFVLDYSTIFFSGMGYDFKTLTFNINTEKVTLFEKFIDNLFYKLRTWIEDTYNKNHDVKIVNEAKNHVKTDKTHVKTDVKTDNIIMLKGNVKALEHIKKDVKTDVKRTNVKKSEAVKRYLAKIYNDNDLVDVKTLKDKFDLTAREWQTVKREIDELITKGTNTYFIRNTILQEV